MLHEGSGAKKPDYEKELRPPATYIRIFFAFDPRRIAILIIGGDKTDRWQEWYDENILQMHCMTNI